MFPAKISTRTLVDEKSMKPAMLILLGLLLYSSTNARATALYNVTDLGENAQLQTESNGHLSGITVDGGDVTYAFQKSPVTLLNEWSPLSNHNSAYRLITMENNGHRVGYERDYSSATGDINYPTFSSFSRGWYTRSGSPVLDLNMLGQAVGTSEGILFPSDSPLHGVSTFAGFSDVNGQAHISVGPNYSGGASRIDNLNFYIDPIPNVYLTSAIKIDDLGRILTVGSDSHNYLLTPVELGTAATVPEPTTLMLLGLVGSCLGIRRLRRSKTAA
jgi:hypothetical protein